MFETLSDVLGPFAASASKDVVVGDPQRVGAASPHIAELVGKQLVWVSETDEGERLNSGQVKKLTGGGKQKGRALFSNLVEFRPTHTIMLLTNKMPHAPADDQALWDRLALLPFVQRFVDRPDPQNPREHQKDANLKDTLLGEASGILAWLVGGTLAWRDGGLQVPDVVRGATKDYRQSEDTIAQWVAECCVTGDGLKALATPLFASYKAWSAKDKEATSTSFGKLLAKKYARTHTMKGWVYAGIGLLDEQERVRTLFAEEAEIGGDDGLPDPNPSSPRHENDGYDGFDGFMSKVPRENHRDMESFDMNPSNPSTRHCSPPAQPPGPGQHTPAKAVTPAVGDAADGLGEVRCPACAGVGCHMCRGLGTLPRPGVTR